MTYCIALTTPNGAPCSPILIHRARVQRGRCCKSGRKDVIRKRKVVVIDAKADSRIPSRKKLTNGVLKSKNPACDYIQCTD